MLHVLGEVHESVCDRMEQRLLLGAVERASQREQSIELIDRHQGRAPSGAY